MRLFLIFFALFSFSDAKAANWISIEPDRFNLLYSEGESATILFRILSQPTHPDYQIAITIEPEGESPNLLTIESGRAVYVSSPLTSGTKRFLVTAHILGPEGYEQVVQENSLNLVVQPAVELLQ